MKEKKSLCRILLNTAAFTTVAYPVHSGLSALVYSDETFMGNLKDPQTAAQVAGMGIGCLILYGLGELGKRYKITRRDEENKTKE